MYGFNVVKLYIFYQILNKQIYKLRSNHTCSSLSKQQNRRKKEIESKQSLQMIHFKRNVYFVDLCLWFHDIQTKTNVNDAGQLYI